MEILRTPDDRFDHLPDYPWAPHYAADLPGFAGLRMHYLDEGRAKAPHSYLCLHGQPTWSYLYRHMLPPFLAAGARVVAPDLFGFGRSDKPTDDAWYGFERHRDALVALIEKLDLRHITLVVQDWGGLLGLTLPPEMPGRFERLLIMNTALATAESRLTDGFYAWRDYSNANPDMDIARLMRRSCPSLGADEAAAYGAPFPDVRYKAGVRRFPNMVPDSPEAEGVARSRRARDWWRSQWQGQTFMAIGATDPVLGLPVMQALAKIIRGCPEPYVHAEAGHFVQEWGEDIARRALAAFGDVSLGSA